MDAWSIVAWLGTAHVLGSALALVVTLGHNDFWSYSGHPYNLGGYISMASVSVFGLLGALFAHLLYPATRPALDRIGRRRMAMLVTVLVALEPVMATIGALAWRVNRSISPDIFTPRAAASRSAGVARARPGLT